MAKAAAAAATLAQAEATSWPQSAGGIVVPISAPRTSA